jgi:rhomboid family GlyGly-CTERM serine protease
MPIRFPFLTLTVAAISVAVFLLPDAATAALQFDRNALAAGEWWRFITAHLTHFDANHLAWDVGALIVLGSIGEATSRRRTSVALAVASVAISAAVWAWQPQFETYRGLSGIDCSLFGYFAAALIQQRRRESVVLGTVALLGVTAKCLFELITGTTAFATGSGYAPVPLAHLVGVAAGIAATLIAPRWRRVRVPPAKLRDFVLPEELHSLTLVATDMREGMGAQDDQMRAGLPCPRTFPITFPRESCSAVPQPCHRCRSSQSPAPSTAC